MGCLVASAMAGAYACGRRHSGSGAAWRSPTWCFIVYNGIETVGDSFIARLALCSVTYSTYYRFVSIFTVYGIGRSLESQILKTFNLVDNEIRRKYGYGNGDDQPVGQLAC